MLVHGVTDTSDARLCGRTSDWQSGTETRATNQTMARQEGGAHRRRSVTAKTPVIVRPVPAAIIVVQKVLSPEAQAQMAKVFTGLGNAHDDLFDDLAKVAVTLVACNNEL